ncbi:MAG: class I SAM-dependent methyltransferase [Alphaproteobacteria bacterium]
MQDSAAEIDMAIPPKRKRKQSQFLKAWVRSPLAMGSVVPSSRWLARAMAAQVDTTQEGVVIELGAGTGVVTHELLHSGIPVKNLLVVEREPRLHGLLKAHYPAVNIVCTDALHLNELLKEQGITKVNAIVSSLPLLSIPKEIRRAIVAQMAAAIGDEGRIIQFTYGPGSPISRYSLEKNALVGHRVKTVIANVPPAHVWVYRGDL